MENNKIVNAEELVQEAFEKEKGHRWDQVKIRFSWVNMEGVVVETYLPMSELHRDWHGECLHCPENDAKVFGLKIGTTPIQNEPENGVVFEDIMALIEKTWPRKREEPPKEPSFEETLEKLRKKPKRGRPSNAYNDLVKKGIFPDR